MNKGADLADSGTHYTDYTDYTDALNNKGLALDNLRNYTGAIKYYDKLLAIDPNDESTLLKKGYDLYQLGNWSYKIL